ncbi:MAG TPA: carboxypeptidase-like regulatory domain-containing protein, partial [Candidatus Nanoarchaeia archaeon]|nr:carboxypeptidase-like regulatory domain-containing protein [Candidatus Nanoarchaeia archaeon]
MLRAIQSALLACLFLFACVSAHGQATGSIKGIVSTAAGEYRLHSASVLLIELNRRVQTNAVGEFQFTDVPAGRYTLVVHSPGLGDSRRTIEVAPGEAASIEFKLRVARVSEQVTVTASGRQETTFESFQSTTSLESIDLLENARTSL